MREDFSRIVTLIWFLILLSTTNVSAVPMPIIEGSTFRFERIREMNCEVYPYRHYDNTEIGEKEKYGSQYLITNINYEDETIRYKYTGEDLTRSMEKSISIDPLQGKIHPSFEPIFGLDRSNRVGEIFFYSEYLPWIIIPEFEELNSMIKDSLYREHNNHLGEAIKVEFMGKDSIEEGAKKLDKYNRKWSIYLYFQNEVDPTGPSEGELWDIKVWREWEYSLNGLLKYSKIRKEAKLVNEDDWCTFEAIYRNMDSFFSILYGTKLGNSLLPLTIPVIVIFSWVKRKKIRELILL